MVLECVRKALFCRSKSVLMRTIRYVWQWRLSLSQVRMKTIHDWENVVTRRLHYDHDWHNSAALWDVRRRTGVSWEILPCALDLCFRNCFCHFQDSHWMLSNLVRCTDLDMLRQIYAHSCTYASLQNESIMTFDYSPSGRTVRWSPSPSVVWELIWIVLVTNGTWRVGSRELRIADWCPLFATYGTLECWNR